MCAEEEGDGKAIGGGVSSIIHQLMYQTALPIYLSLQGVERVDVFSVWVSSFLWLRFSPDVYISIFLPSIAPFCSLLRMDDGERAASNSAHRSRLHWHGRLVRGAVSDATRRLHSGSTQEVWSHTSVDGAGGWSYFFSFSSRTTATASDFCSRHSVTYCLRNSVSSFGLLMKLCLWNGASSPLDLILFKLEGVCSHLMLFLVSILLLRAIRKKLIRNLTLVQFNAKYSLANSLIRIHFNVFVITLQYLILTTLLNWLFYSSVLAVIHFKCYAPRQSNINSYHLT